MEEEILKLIEESKEVIGRKSQHIELLKRNRSFLNDLRGIKRRLGLKFFKIKNLDFHNNLLTKISEDNLLIKLNYPRIIWFDESKIYMPVQTAKKLDKTDDKSFALQYFLSLADTLLSKTLKVGWNHATISSDVDDSEVEKDPFFKESPHLNLICERRTEELDKNIAYRREILARYHTYWFGFCSAREIAYEWNGNLSDLEEFIADPIIGFYIEPSDVYLPIHLRIGPWTTQSDVIKIWGEIQKLQKEVSHKEKESPNFGRDLCWYDLNKKYNLSPGKIAKLWTNKCREEIDMAIIKRIKHKHRELETEDDQKILKKIMSDKNLSEIKEEFEYLRESYIKGPYSPLKDLIKKSINKMELRIKKINDYSNI